MPPLPKRKYPKARQGDRRSHLALTLAKLVPCPQCHNLKPSHRICPTCGFYGGREVIKVKAASSKK